MIMRRNTEGCSICICESGFNVRANIVRVFFVCSDKRKAPFVHFIVKIDYYSQGELKIELSFQTVSRVVSHSATKYARKSRL